MQPMTATSFRAITSPAFLDPNKFPDEQIDFWLAQARETLRADIWRERHSQGVMYYVAHQLAMAERAGRGGAGGASGIVASKSIGGASISYDNSAIVAPGAGTFNLTTWGQQYWQLVQIVGTGIVQVSPQLLRGYGGPRYPQIR